MPELKILPLRLTSEVTVTKELLQNSVYSDLGAIENKVRQEMYNAINKYIVIESDSCILSDVITITARINIPAVQNEQIKELQERIRDLEEEIEDLDRGCWDAD